MPVQEYYYVYFIFMDDNACSHRTHIVNDFLEEDDIHHMSWLLICPDLNSIGHVWDGIGKAIVSHNPFSEPFKS